MNFIDYSVCEWSEAQYFIISENIWGNFIYYSHFFPSLAGLLIALVLFINAPKFKPAQALLFTTFSFAIWSFLDLILWATERPDVIMFVWSILIYFDIFIYVGSFYFVYSYFNKRFPGFIYELIIFSLFIPLFLFTHTKINLTAFDFTNCWREALEGPLWTHYIYNVELGFVTLILFTAFNYFRTNKARLKEILLITSGTVLFLITFSIGNILGAIETDWEIGQIGLFGMPVFAAVLAYTVIRYQTFKVKIFAAEALFAGMSLLLVSTLFVRTVENARVITSVTLVLFLFLGTLLIRSVRREIEQRQEIQKLATGLERANDRLRVLDKQKSEFVSIASHQLRSPLTAIRGYASMILEGSYGEISEKVRDPLKRIEESGKFMAVSIDDFLNVSRIESGNMKYEFKSVNLPELATQVVADLESDASQRGLLLLLRSHITGSGIVTADYGKTQQILHNLINNALKYTLKGTVTVYVHDDLQTKQLFVEVIDTGIGMSEETVTKLFEKFTRAKTASSSNIMGTGLGLFVAREMAKAMKGNITAHSEGEGMGSRFVFSMPLE